MPFKHILPLIFCLCVFTPAASGQELTPIYCELVEIMNIENTTSLAWNPDGSTLAISGVFQDRLGIWFYNPVSEEITGFSTKVLFLNLAWSPAENLIVGISFNNIGNTYSTFRTVDGKLLSQFENSPTLLPLLWGSDSNLIMISGSDSVLVYNAFTGLVERELLVSSNIPRGGGLVSTAWNIAEERAYGVFGLRDMFVWNSTTGDLIDEVEFPYDIIHPMALNSAGDKFAIPSGRRVFLVNSSTLAIEIILEALTDDPIRDVVWHEDNIHLATFGGDNIIRIWNVTTGAEVGSISTGGLILGVPAWRPNTYQLSYNPLGGSPTTYTVTTESCG